MHTPNLELIDPFNLGSGEMSPQSDGTNSQNNKVESFHTMKEVSPKFKLIIKCESAKDDYELEEDGIGLKEDVKYQIKV